MISERVFIENVMVPIEGTLNPSISKSIKDIREPDKAKSTYSKTVKIPSSKEADEVFAHYFMYNNVTADFNPNVKHEVKYEVGGEVILEGYCQLKEVETIDHEKRVYNIVMFGETSNFFADIKDLKLEDVDLSLWNHPFDRTLQVKSWGDPSAYGITGEVWYDGGFIPFEYGNGYVYILMDYGFTPDLTIWDMRHISLSLYVKTIVDQIFVDAGWEYESTFFESDFFKRLIIPFSPEIYALDTDEIAERSIHVVDPEMVSTGTDTSGNITKESFSTPDVILFNTEIADVGADYNPATGIWTCPATGVYDFIITVDIQAHFTPDSIDNPMILTSDIHGYIMLFQDPTGAPTETQVDAVNFYITRDYDDGAQNIVTDYDTTDPTTYPDADFTQAKTWSVGDEATVPPRNVNPPNRYQIYSASVPCQTGDTFRVKWKAKYMKNPGGDYWEGNSAPVDGEATITLVNASWKIKPVNALIDVANEVKISKALRGNWKQSEFIMSLAKMFNLYIEPHTDHPKKLRIETREDYLSSTVKNIHEKIDRSKESIQTPMAEFNDKTYRYGYKRDSDYYNEKYFKSWQEGYGDRIIENLNEFTQSDKNHEISFSPTPLVGEPGSGFILPTCLQLNDAGEPKSTKHNMRILYYDGLHESEKVWKHRLYYTIFSPFFDDDLFYQYPYAGHLDDPFAPTLDINFGMVKELYYDNAFEEISMTNNNLFNAYHQKQFLQTTNSLARIVTNYVHMTARDFKEFTFDKLYYFDKHYWLLNEIKNFNPSSPATTQCEWLLVKNVGAFAPLEIDVSDDPADFDPDPPYGNEGFADMQEQLPVTHKKPVQDSSNSYNGISVKVKGQANRVGSRCYDINIQGDYNVIWSECQNITLDNSHSNTIEAGLQNITLINTSGLTITESDVTYIDGKRQGYWLTVTSDFTADDTVVGYYIDASGGDVTATISGREKPSDWIFKRMDNSANTVTLDPSASITIDGDLTQTLLQYESIRIRWNEDEQEYSIVN